jgi:hypothetical protein
VVEFPEDRQAIEIIPRAHADLPLSITGNTAVWENSENWKASGYCLKCLDNDSDCPTIEYINDKWYYLTWNHNNYYTVPHSQITTPLGLRLGTRYALLVEALQILTKSESTTDVSKGLWTEVNPPTSV